MRGWLLGLLAIAASARGEVLSSAGVETGDPLAVAPSSRAELGAPSLTGKHGAGPWRMEAFTKPNSGSPAPETTRNIFEGRLKLIAERPAKGFHVLVDSYGVATADGGAAVARLPDFDFEFLQSAGALIPVRRGSIPGGHGRWEFILEPGRVWDEPEDGGYTRAALPFTLEERNENCMHNGVLTFLFRGDGSVSDVAFEIAQETCLYLQFDWWGFAQARYSPGTVAGRGALIARYRDEVAGRLPTRPISQLAQDYPGTRPENFASAQELEPQSLTVHGVVIDGVHYSSDCPTRFGTYPFCDVLDLPSYSLSKSIVGGIGTMRLNTLIPQFAESAIVDWVPQCAGRDGWQGVTVQDTLDMMTGRYLSPAFEHDEEHDSDGFFAARSHAAKLEFACTHFPRRANPGEVWVYRTTDTYVLGTALANSYAARFGKSADFYDGLLARDIWKPLRLSPVMDVPRRTYDAAAQVFTGYGLTLHRDDIAKIAGFLNVAHGRIEGRVMLDQAMLDDALHRTSDRRRPPTGSDDIHYRNGFWSWNAQHALGCRQPTWIPLMGGFGGIVVELLPNGMTYYYFSDGGRFKYALGAEEANRIRPFCAK